MRSGWCSCRCAHHDGQTRRHQDRDEEFQDERRFAAHGARLRGENSGTAAGFHGVRSIRPNAPEPRVPPAAPLKPLLTSHVLTASLRCSVVACAAHCRTYLG